MRESSDEEKLLLKREYKKYKNNLKKNRIREQHFRCKDEGYTLASDRICKNKNLYSIYIGFLTSKGISKEKIIDKISLLLYEDNVNLEEEIELSLIEKNADRLL